MKIPDFIFQELSKRKKENRLILEANPDTTEFQDYVCLGATARIKSTATPGSTLRSITKNALLPALNMTDLRHMSAYILAEMGVDIESISHILGHTKLSSTIAFCCNFPDENNEIQSVLSNTLDPVLGIRNSLGKEVSHAQGKEH
ncbi:MAG: tyrosine-type recombinase/integrase [Ruminococcus sp.]